MEAEQIYAVDITPEGEQYYLDLLENIYATHSVESASAKSDEILAMAMSLDKMPYRGIDEPLLSFLEKDHKYLVYQITSRNTVKIIYFIEEELKTVYITDFFPTAQDTVEIASRNK